MNNHYGFLTSLLQLKPNSISAHLRIYFVHFLHLDQQTGHPTANITWKLNKEPIKIIETERYESLIPSVLSVKKVSAEDQGRISL